MNAVTRKTEFTPKEILMRAFPGRCHFSAEEYKMVELIYKAVANGQRLIKKARSAPAVGSVIEYRGVKLVAVPGSNCLNCWLNGKHDCSGMICKAVDRADGKNILFLQY